MLARSTFQRWTRNDERIINFDCPNQSYPSSSGDWNAGERRLTLGDKRTRATQASFKYCNQDLRWNQVINSQCYWPEWNHGVEICTTAAEWLGYTIEIAPKCNTQQGRKYELGKHTPAGNSRYKGCLSKSQQIRYSILESSQQHY